MKTHNTQLILLVALLYMLCFPFSISVSFAQEIEVDNADILSPNALSGGATGSLGAGSIEVLNGNIEDKLSKIDPTCAMSLTSDPFDPCGPAGFSISKSSVFINENGGLDTFTVRLNSIPANDVVFNIVAVSTNDVTVSTPTLTFNSANWHIPQIVTLTGVNDSLFTEDTAIITISVNDELSNDDYDGLADKTIAVNLINDDTAQGGVIFGGGSISGGGFGGAGFDNGEILGATTDFSCDQSFNLMKPIKLGANNDPRDVKLLQIYLNTYENTNFVVNGFYSQENFNKVVLWQEKYSDAILKPWGITKGTGFVYITSLKEINKVYTTNCLKS